VGGITAQIDMAVTIPANDRKASNLYFASLGLDLVINLATGQFSMMSTLFAFCLRWY
jgi:hypothetical protein